MSKERLRVLTLSKPYVAAAYRHKLRALAAAADLEIGLICPPQWASQKLEPEDGTPPFWMRVLPIRFNGRNHFHYYEGLEAAVREFRPDVFNVEEEHYSLVTLQAFRIARKVGAVPLFYTWQNIQKSYPPPFSWIERYVFRTAGAAIVGNAEAGEILRAKGYSGPMHEIPQMGVVLERFAPRDSGIAPRHARRRALGLSDATLWLSFMGRIVEEKGVQDIVRALAKLHARSPDLARGVRLLLVGDGPYLPALVALAKELGVEQQVVHKAFIPSQQVADYLQAVDVLCLPSLTRANWKEQFGRILTEAMAAEAVVVGSSSGEIPRVIGDAGCTFPEGDAAALADVIERLARDENLQDQLRRKGAARVRERYTNEIVAGAFAAAFKACAGRKS